MMPAAHPPVPDTRRNPVLRSLRMAAEAALDLLLPPHCPSCAGPVATQGTHCPPCFAALTFITAPLCTVCGLPFGSQALAGPLRLCSSCLESPPPWGQARAALLYDDAARALILPFKHADRQENAAILAAHMARAGQDLLEGTDLLIPVPLHRRRLRARGFNQAALLARVIARRTAIACLPDGLERIRHTRPLGDLSAVMRQEAMQEAVHARPSRRPAIAGRRILLIDDVMTSGATAAACARALQAAGAAQVDVLVAARVPNPRD
jgi:ComF family protein